MNQSSLQNSIFVVNEEPFCIWEIDFLKRNMEFLNGIDTEYFDYVLKVHLNSDDEKKASIALRTTLHHAMETFFSFLGAYIQAPTCAYAWIAKCSNRNLRDFVGQVGRPNNTLFTKLNIPQVTWENVAGLVFQRYMPNSERNKKTIQLFASLWQRLANEYRDQNNIDEYNSLKHGFRVRPGGFGLSAGLEHEYGVAPPAEEMQLLGKSDFGTSFLKIESIGKGDGNRSVRSRQMSVNWKIEKVALLIQLISMSINNIVSALKIVNGAKAEDCKFLRPQDDEEFDKPWHHSPGVTNCSLDFVIKDEEVTAITKEELLEKLRNKKRKS
jgi:hypothetical protein